MARSRGWTPRWWTDFSDEHPQATQLLHQLRAFLPPLNLITIHYAYFIIVILVTSLIFWGSSDPAFSISYVDSLFLVVSAMTEAGLNTVNLSQMTTWQQILLWLLILLGGTVWVSIWTVAFRLHAFEQRFKDIVRLERERRDRIRRPGSSGRLRIRFFGTATLGMAKTAPPGDPTLPGMGSKMLSNGSITDTTGLNRSSVVDRRRSSLPQMDRTYGQANGQGGQDTTPSASARIITFADDPPGLGNRDARTTASVYANDNRSRRRNVGVDDLNEKNDSTTGLQGHKFLTSKTVGRNAQFHDLTSEEREELGGCEYRALKVLAVVVPLYFVLWQLLGCISLGAWIAYNAPQVALSNGLNPWWTGIFFGASAFQNSGMALLDQNVVPFQNSYFVLIVMGAMILAGNTAYPILLRFIFWAMWKVLPWTTGDETLSEFKETLKFILKYPRRVYTNMFPARQTWWLLFMVCLLNFTDWAAFEVLNLGNPTIEAIPVGSRIIDGLFQGIGI